MDIVVEPGTYVVAVSGGVDSMVLLELLRQKPDIKLVIAHYDHGIRDDSDLDRQLVQQVAKKHGLPFVYDHGNLGLTASEAKARTARYEFLHRIRQASGARAIITAHHEDDLLETALLNMLRGTGRRGLTSLQSFGMVLRPLLHVPKAELIAYAQEQQLPWHEDNTNVDERYARNTVRHQIVSRLAPEQRQGLATHIRRLHEINHELERQLEHYLHLQTASKTLDRQDFIRLPHIVAREVMAAWLRHNGIANYDKRTLERLVVAAKTFRPGQRTDVTRNRFLSIHKQKLALE
jgi:tRNA(Ile)-lysidine synthase